MRLLLLIAIITSIAGCAAASPAPQPAGPVPSPIPTLLRPETIKKVGPDLRRHLLQRGRQALETPDSLDQQFRPVTVTIQSARDITEELESQKANVRSVIQNGVVVTTADVPLTAIPNLLALPDLMTMELTKPVAPVGGEQQTEDGAWRMDNGR